MAVPARSTAYEFEWAPSPLTSRFFPPPSRIPTEFSPPLIAMVAVIATAALIVLLRLLHRRFRRWRRRRNLLSASFSGDPFDSPPATFSSSDQYFFSPYYGLDELSIKSLPLSLYSKSRLKLLEASGRECSVCLIDFSDGDQLRSLPLCSHAFHVECIDAWLRSHATCPLCRSGVFIPVRAARIRPSLEDLILILDPPPPPEPEISAASPPPDRDFLLKRSYSFGFEQNFAADSSMASPWRYRHQRGFWSKRWPSPFGVSGGSRVFSFRSYRGGGGVSAGKSPFGKRRGLFPSSNGGGTVGPSWRRNRAMTSPSAVFMRSVMSAGPAVTGFSSSRMRCGDPEALLSPDRLGGRRSDYRWGGGR